jgi:hypothetical protein
LPLSPSPIRLLKKKFHNLDSNLIDKLTNREVLLIFDPIIEYLSYVVSDVITFDHRVEPTFISQAFMVCL